MYIVPPQHRRKPLTIPYLKVKLFAIFATYYYVEAARNKKSAILSSDASKEDETANYKVLNNKNG